MVLEYTSSDKDEPQAIPSGAAPTFAADISEFATWLSAGRIYRKAATQAALNALTGMDDDDLGIVDNVDGGWWRYNGSVPIWELHGLPRFASVAARDAAITVPRSGMRCIAAGAQFVYVSGWRLAEVTRFADATARDAALTAPALGDQAVLTSDEITYRYSGSAWVAWNKAWGSYAPTVSNFASATTGPTTVGRYCISEGTVHTIVTSKLGTGTITVGNITVSLPIAAATTGLFADSSYFAGNVSMVDVTGGPQNCGGYVRYIDANTVRVMRESAGGADVRAVTSSTTPFTWATLDEISLAFSYPVA